MLNLFNGIDLDIVVMDGVETRILENKDEVGVQGRTHVDLVRTLLKLYVGNYNILGVDHIIIVSVLKDCIVSILYHIGSYMQSII